MARLRDILAEHLVRARQVRGWNQEELADRSGLSLRFIGKIERRQVAASIDTIEQIAKALRESPDALLRK
jgi:transcriptional regulator with XRE-family HTH domain